MYILRLMSKAFYVELPNRGAVRLEGPDRVAFLQGLVSNDVAKASADMLVYACLLTPQGKFLHDFFVRADGEALILDCEGGERAKDLHDRLMKFRLRSKVAMSLEEHAPVYAVLGEEAGLPDPRHETLGRRAYQKPDGEIQGFDVYEQIRLIACIPDGSRDMEIERSTLLECRIDKLNGIDWNKGCYMGQELTARMHYRGLAKKHLYTVELFGEAPPTFSDLPQGGSMRSSSHSLGLALLRDDTVETFDYEIFKVKR